MKILLLGKNGQVGCELNKLLKRFGTLIALGREQLDFSNLNSIEPLILDICPDVIINAAAYTAVDKAEKEPELVMTINAAAPGILAQAAKLVGAGLIHYSSDYVFDGHSDTAYKEESPTCPINVYGKSKLAGEKAIMELHIPYLIFRTSWVYSLYGKNFLKTIKKMAEGKDPLRIVDDQIGSPTWARSIALATHQILEQCLQKNWLKDNLQTHSGIFHLTCQGKTSWHGFAKELLSLSGIENTKLVPISTSEYPTPAIRPLYSILCNDKVQNTFNVELPNWENALKDCLTSA